MNSAEQLILELNLTPHPEGGYYKRTYASNEQTIFHGNSRPCTTMIYYLLKGYDQSVFHRLKSDEIWVYQLGSAVVIHCIDINGCYSRLELGSNIENDEQMQIIIQAGTWFAAELKNKIAFALTTCVVSPGFDFADFEIGEKVDLNKLFPQHSAIINRMSI